MSKHSTSQQVPKDMQARFDDITQLTDTFSQAYLTDEYASLCRQLTATLSRKRPSPLSQGKAATWACGIIHALGMVNFLFDASQTPHVPAMDAPVQDRRESPDLDAGGQWVHHGCAPCPTRDPGGSVPQGVDPLYPCAR